MQYVTQIGLVADIIGALGLFKYGLPSPIKTESGATFVDADPPEDELREIRRFNEKVNRNARISLGLLILGFILQFIGSLSC
jgi:hypothetical protein